MNNLDRVKSILEIIDDSQEPLLSHIVNTVNVKVRAYCGYDLSENIPDGLSELIIDIAVTQCKYSLPTDTGETTVIAPTSGVLKAKTIGGTKYEYDTDPDVIAASNSTNPSSLANSFLSDYKLFLNKYKKRKVIMI